MRMFEDREECEKWLESLGYEEFWREISTFSLEIQDREICDELIASGKVPENKLLRLLKTLVRMQVVEQQRLKLRDNLPHYTLH